MYVEPNYRFETNSKALAHGSQPMAHSSRLTPAPEVPMNCRAQWILWAIAMVVLAVLALSGRTLDLGLAIAAVAVVWYVIVPALNSGRQ